MKGRIIISLIIMFGFSSFTCSQTIDETIEWFTMGEGLTGTARGVAVIGNDVYVGGQFALAGGTLVNNIAKWNGSSWSALGSGVDGWIQAVAVIGNDVYVAGFFSLAGGDSANNIAKWDGSTWSPLGDGVNELVLCLAVDGTDLYAGGFFTEAGGVSANRIAKWDGFSWSPLGSGINNEVNAITISGNDLYAGGIFNLAGGTSVSGLARWDGSNWFDVGGGVNGIARAIAVVGNDVYVGGVFSMVGGSVSARIAKWDGSQWHTLGDGVNGSVFSLKQSENDLYVGGMFTSAGGQTANRIAKFNMVTSTWSPIGNGATGSVDAMAIQGSTHSMIVGGAFNQVGNVLQANSVARFTDSENPLPVELVSFSASQVGNNVKINWSTATEINNKGFEILRSTQNDNSNWTNIGFAQGYGATTEPKYYSFTDDNPGIGKISYRLKQIDHNGSFSCSHIVEIDFTGVTEFRLEQNYPNPFNPTTNIEYTIPQYVTMSEAKSQVSVQLKVYDVLGNEVATLVNELQAAGSYNIEFGALRLSSGIYYYQLSAGSLTQTKKLVLLK